MGFFSRRAEKRAEDISTDEVLLRAMLRPDAVTRETALQIPAVSGAISLISDIIAATPIKLYRDNYGKAAEVKDDPRVRLLNDDTGDTLSAHDFWGAMIRDYYLGKGAYAYINRAGGRWVSLHYVPEDCVAIVRGADHIFKDYDIYVDGRRYYPFQFLKILRNTRDGATGAGIVQENSELLAVAYATLQFEKTMVKKGGNKRGFLKSSRRLTEPAMNELKKAFRRLYANDSEEPVVILNEGLDFKESSNTSVEMQLNEGKVTNANEIAKLFHVAPSAITGTATEQEISALAKLAAIPLMTKIECSLNRDLLLESEKGSYYFAFDTKELLKGPMLGRYQAYEIAIRSGLMTRNEIRYAEDLPPIDGMDIVSMNLSDVIYDPKTRTFFTPNTRQVTDGRTGSAAEAPSKGGETEDETGDPR